MGICELRLKKRTLRVLRVKKRVHFPLSVQVHCDSHVKLSDERCGAYCV